MRENAKEVPKIKSYNKKQENFSFSFFENEFFIFFENRLLAPYLCGWATPRPYASINERRLTG